MPSAPSAALPCTKSLSDPEAHRFSSHATLQGKRILSSLSTRLYAIVFDMPVPHIFSCGYSGCSTAHLYRTYNLTVTWDIRMISLLEQGPWMLHPPQEDSILNPSCGITVTETYSPNFKTLKAAPLVFCGLEILSQYFPQMSHVRWRDAETDAGQRHSACEGVSEIDFRKCRLEAEGTRLTGPWRGCHPYGDRTNSA